MNVEGNNYSTERRKHLQRGQGIAEYSLIIALVGIVCVAILVMLGRGTKNVIYKVTCSAGSTDAQCGCINEQLTVTSTYPNGCTTTTPKTLLVKVTSSCATTTLTIGPGTYSSPANVNWPNAPICTGGATTFTVSSAQSGGPTNNYNVSPP